MSYKGYRIRNQAPFRRSILLISETDVQFDWIVRIDDADMKVEPGGGSINNRIYY